MKNMFTFNIKGLQWILILALVRIGITLPKNSIVYKTSERSTNHSELSFKRYRAIKQCTRLSICDDPNNNPGCESFDKFSFARTLRALEFNINFVVQYGNLNTLNHISSLINSTEIHGRRLHCEDYLILDFMSFDFNYRELCLQGDQNAHCNGKFKFPENVGKLIFIKFLSIGGFHFEYISPRFIPTVFPNLLALEVYDSERMRKILYYPSLLSTDTLVPASIQETSYRNLEILQFTELKKVEMVVFPEKELIVSKAFYYLMKRPILPQFTLKSFWLGEDTLKEMTIDVTSRKLTIEMPTTTERGGIENFTVYLPHANLYGERVHFDYTKFRGTIRKFNLVGSSVNDVNNYISKVWPSTTILPNYEESKIEIRELELRIWKMQELTKLMETPAKNQIKIHATSLRNNFKTDQLDNQKFIVTEMKTIANLLGERNTNIHIRTYYLVVDNCIIGSLFKRKLTGDVTVRFLYLVLPEHCDKIYAFAQERGIQPNNIFHNEPDLQSLWPEINRELFFKVMNRLTEYLKRDSRDQDVLRHSSKLYGRFLNDFSDKEINDISSLNFLEKQLFQNMQRQLKISATMVQRKLGRYQMLPRFSLSTFKEKTQVYNRIAQTLLSVEQYSSTLGTVAKGQKLLLEISKTKSTTDLKLAAESLKHLERKRKAANDTFEKLKGIRIERYKSVNAETDKFNAAVTRRQHQAYFEAVMGIFSAITSVFTGGFGAIEKIGEVAQKMAKLIETVKRIYKMVHRLTQVFEILSKLAGDIMQSYNDINVAQEGFDPGNMKEIVGNITSVDEADLLEWNEAEKHVEGMMDASLSMEIPETLGFKTALLKMIAAGKAETEAFMSLTETDGQICLAAFQKEAYNEELKKIEIEVAQYNVTTKQTEETDMIKVGNELEMFKKNLNFEIFLHLLDYCSASLYSSLQPCDAFQQLDIDNSLLSVIFLINKLQLDTIQDANALFPPPQSFYDKTIRLELKSYCESIVSKFDEAYNKFCNKGSAETLEGTPLQECKDQMATIIPELYDELPKSDRTISAQPPLTNDKKEYIFRQRYDDCLVNNILELQTNKNTSVTIGLRNKEFESYDRVRIEEIKVNLEGVSTTSGMIELTIGNNGIMQDRLNQQTFIFSASDEWKRTIRYKIAEPSDQKRYEIRGDMHDSFRNTFYAPTPFSTWLITVSEENNPGLSLSELKAIEIKFSGSLMVSQEQDKDYEEKKKEMNMVFKEIKEEENLKKRKHQQEKVKSKKKEKKKKEEKVKIKGKNKETNTNA